MTEETSLREELRKVYMKWLERLEMIKGKLLTYQNEVELKEGKWSLLKISREVKSIQGKLRLILENLNEKYYNVQAVQELDILAEQIIKKIEGKLEERELELLELEAIRKKEEEENLRALLGQSIARLSFLLQLNVARISRYKIWRIFAEFSKEISLVKKYSKRRKHVPVKIPKKLAEKVTLLCQRYGDISWRIGDRKKFGKTLCPNCHIALKGDKKSFGHGRRPYTQSTEMYCPKCGFVRKL